MKTWLKRWVLGGAIALLVLFSWISPASAGVNDDRYEGNIFPLYAGNGYLVPPRVTLKQSFDRDTPTVLVFYIDDSRDCKKFAPVLSSVDAFYGRVVNIIPIDVDAIPVKDSYDRTEPGRYYKGLVPQTLVFDRSGEVILDEVGDIPYEKVDDVLREVFDLLPRNESVELKRREVNELNTELVPADQV
ncbi:thylakoid membrane photosystem I accumulation factor [Vacuolonema iberomarrocanum]|uniref:thylakoid membrane photosystem I accumulation factor n=1 Tax=Vacuolonema iberomarrocanum TaxID=3454632 RepID=UPI003F6E16E8